MPHFIGVTFYLRGDSITTDGSGHVNITDIGYTDETALICHSEMPTSEEVIGTCILVS